MITRATGAVLLLAILAAPCPAQPDAPVLRGTLFRSKRLGFAMWMPAGFDRDQSHHEAHVTATFVGGTTGGSHILVASHKATDAGQIEQHITTTLRQKFEGVPFEPITGFEAAGKPAIVHCARFDRVPWRKQTLRTIYVGFFAYDGYRMLAMKVPSGRFPRALDEIRWMLSTIRPAGREGLRRFVMPRRLDESTGILYAPPRGFDSRPPDEGALWTGTQRTPQRRFRAVVASEKKASAALEAALAGGSPAVSRYALPHAEGLEVLAATCLDRRGCRIVAAMQLGDERSLVATAEGVASDRDPLVRILEAFLIHTTFIDIAETQRRATRAIDGLAAALRGRDDAAATEHAATLSELAFLAEPRFALAKAVARLPAGSTRRNAVTALVQAGNADVASTLLRALKDRAVRGDAATVAAILAGIGAIDPRRAAPVLRKHAKHDDPVVAAAAIRGCGHLHASARATVKRLASTMRREEEAGRTGSAAARERWEQLAPAFKQALLSLTNGKVDHWEHARNWRPGS